MLSVRAGMLSRCGSFRAVAPRAGTLWRRAHSALAGEEKVEPAAPLTQTDVFECQKKWAAAIVGCSKIYAEGGTFAAHSSSA